MTKPLKGSMLIDGYGHHKKITMKYFVYARKSSEDAEKQALSIESQVDKAKEIFSDYDIVEFLTESASAFKNNNRPVFYEMLKRIDKGEAQGIIAWHPDRLSRNALDAAQVYDRVTEGVIKDLRFGSYTFDNSPEGMMMLQIVMSQSQYFSSKLSKDVVRGLDKKVSMGWKPGVVKAGYLNTPEMDKGMRVITTDPERFPIVRKMWDLLLTGAYTVPQILEIVNNQWGFRTVQRKYVGGTPLGRSTLYAMFTDVFYAGMILHKGEMYPGKHEAMITLEEFDRAQMVMGRKGKPRPQKHRFAFTGFIRCGECGCAITAEPKMKVLKSTGQTKTYVYYHCTWKRPCSQRKVMTETELERQITEELNKITIIPEFKDWALEVLDSSNDQEVASRSKLEAMQAKALLDTRQQLDSLTKMRIRELISDDEYTEQRNELQSQITKLKEELHDTESRADKWLELTEKTFEFATYARENFSRGDLNIKKEIFVALGQNATIRDGKLNIELNEWFKPIAENHAKLEADFNLVRTKKFRSPQGKTELIGSLSHSWLRRPDSNRQPSP